MEDDEELARAITEQSEPDGDLCKKTVNVPSWKLWREPS